MKSGKTKLILSSLALAISCGGCSGAPKVNGESAESVGSGRTADGMANQGKIDRAAIVSAHNKWRAEVGVGKLTYSPELEISAQAWANSLKTNNHCQMRHSNPGGKYGENLYWASAIMWSDGRREIQKVAPESPVEDWASEKTNYNYADNRCAPGKVCGHYTQIIWRDTQTVGCAFAVCEDSMDQIWVCQYQPAGNWVGEKPY